MGCSEKEISIGEREKNMAKKTSDFWVDFVAELPRWIFSEASNGSHQHVEEDRHG